MTQDEIIRMAREAGLIQYVQVEKTCVSNALERFFNLAFEAGAAYEREACAKVCEQLDKESCDWVDTMAIHCAKAIRARGGR